MRTSASLVGVLVTLAGVLLADAASTQVPDEPSCVAEITLRKRGRIIGPFAPTHAGQRFILPVADCDGWNIEDSFDCQGLAAMAGTTASYVAQNEVGGCDLVVVEHRIVVTPIDLEHDPRVRRRAPRGDGDVPPPPAPGR